MSAKSPRLLDANIECMAPLVGYLLEGTLRRDQRSFALPGRLRHRGDIDRLTDVLLFGYILPCPT